MSTRRTCCTPWVLSLLFVPLALFVLAASTKADGIFIYSGGSFTNVVIPGVVSPFPAGINDPEQIVGTDGNGNIGFLCQNGTTNIVTFPGSTATRPVGINDSGTILGRDLLPGQGFQVFVDKSGSFTTLSLPSGATATGINNAGEIVGYGISNEGFLDSNGSITYFKAPGATVTDFDAISNSGEVAGVYFNSSGQHPFVYNSTSGAFESITVPCGTTTLQVNVSGINSKGDVVGDCVGSGHQTGYEYDYLTGQFTAITAPGNQTTFVTGINDRGQIVGVAAPEPSTICWFSGLWV